MPLPFIVGALAATAGVAGVGSGIHGGVKMKNANDKMKSAERKQERAVNLFEKKDSETNQVMDSLGEQELKILESFGGFSDLIEKIQGRPEFGAINKDDVELPKYDPEELKEVSVGAGLLLGGAGGAAVGALGGYAAAGATTSAVMALGTASTGTAISALSGAAATNATLAAIGGGSLAAGGGGVALGTTLLTGATLGVGLLVGGMIFNVTGAKLSDKADEAYSQARRTEREVNKVVSYLDDLTEAANEFKKSLTSIEDRYRNNYAVLSKIIDEDNKTEWSEFTEKEKLITENTVLLVGLLHKMCKVQLVLKPENDEETNTVNWKEIYKISADASKTVARIDSVEAQ